MSDTGELDAVAPQREEIKERLGDLLHPHFRPAIDAGEATTMFTTDQLFGLVEEHAPGTILKSSLRQALLDLSYREIMLEDTSFVWLLRAA